VEVELAGRLRAATQEERLSGLYASVYKERLERIPEHPLLIRAGDEAARRESALRQLRLLAPFVSSRTIFAEIGPGDCSLALAVAPLVEMVYAVDVADGLATADSWPPNIRFVHTDGVCLDVPSESVDLVFSNQVLEHLHPDDAYDHLVEIRRVLRPGGRFVCVTPNRLSGPWDVSRGHDPIATGLHLREYTLSEQADLLRRVGFRVRLVASYHGATLLRRLPERPVRMFERALEQLPAAARRPLAAPLVAAKIVATLPSG
jgi:SAM-dependent methyltransferase